MRRTVVVVANEGVGDVRSVWSNEGEVIKINRELDLVGAK